MPLPYTLSDQAKLELVATLEWSERRFGAQAARRYKQLLRVAFIEISHDPEVIGSHDIGAARLYHIRNCRKKAPVDGVIVKSPRHFVIYREKDSTIEILRILHDQMDIETRLRGLES